MKKSLLTACLMFSSKATNLPLLRFNKSVLKSSSITNRKLTGIINSPEKNKQIQYRKQNCTAIPYTQWKVKRWEPLHSDAKTTEILNLIRGQTVRDRSVSLRLLSELDLVLYVMFWGCVEPELIEGHGYETWQSSLLHIFVGYFEGWPWKKPGKKTKRWLYVLMQMTIRSIAIT